MTQTRTELILQAVVGLITVTAPIIYFYLPDRGAEIDIWVEAALAVVSIVSVVALNWGTAQFIKTRSEERARVQEAMGLMVDSHGTAKSNGVEFLE